jgi:hypothetical protein
MMLSPLPRIAFKLTNPSTDQNQNQNQNKPRTKTRTTMNTTTIDTVVAAKSAATSKATCALNEEVIATPEFSAFIAFRDGPAPPSTDDEDFAETRAWAITAQAHFSNLWRTANTLSQRREAQKRADAAVIEKMTKRRRDDLHAEMLAWTSAEAWLATTRDAINAWHIKDKAAAEDNKDKAAEDVAIAEDNKDKAEDKAPAEEIAVAKDNLDDGYTLPASWDELFELKQSAEDKAAEDKARTLLEEALLAKIAAFGECVKAVTAVNDLESELKDVKLKTDSAIKCWLEDPDPDKRAEAKAVARAASDLHTRTIDELAAARGRFVEISNAKDDADRAWYAAKNAVQDSSCWGYSN